MYALKKCLFFLTALSAVAPAASGYKVEIPYLDVGGNLVPRSVYSKILITPGTPAVKEEGPALMVAGQTPVSRSLYSRIRITPGTPAVKEEGPALMVSGQTPVARSVYNKIQIDGNAETYTLISDDPQAAPNLTYSFDSDPKVSVGTYAYTVTPAVSGTYTLESDGFSSAPDLTYSFDSTPKVSVGTYAYTVTPAVGGSYTLLSNNPDKYDHLTYDFDDQPQILLATDIKDHITSVESIEAEGQGLMTYNSATQTLRTTWADNKEVRISNLSGQTVLTARIGGADRTLSVAHLPAGVYVVSTRGAHALKFIKQ